ncbi:hypothetical protein GCM10022198_11600 [Klugiella xanthotipulae]|uniref:Uncharacterized protein n=1 Tax=Klugiella xanthotipulae TaxID=244735 RepID=A0A543I4V5_9MICO|nr:DUF6188 family protein [Klugiella xanthotipulae]TQM65597.1 hypothetical protein FB466_0402 [Klugiella xanthotipulae]
MSSIDLNLSEAEVIQIRIDYQVTLIFSDSSSVVIECPFSLRGATGIEKIVDPAGKKNQLVEFLELHTSKVLRGYVSDSTLNLEFSNGSTLTCPPSLEYEAWSYFGTGKEPERIIATPGGELSIWNAMAKPD